MAQQMYNVTIKNRFQFLESQSDHSDEDEVDVNISEPVQSDTPSVQAEHCDSEEEISKFQVS